MAARETPTAHSIVYRAVVIVKQCIAAKLIMEGSRWSGRIEARSGLRMMPTFPRSPLSFRTASFPQYGWKAGFPSGAFLGDWRLKPAPGIRRPPSSLHPPFVHFVVASIIP